MTYQTERNIRIANLIKKGRTASEIAAEVGVSKHVVYNVCHREKLKLVCDSKLRVNPNETPKIKKTLRQIQSGICCADLDRMSNQEIIGRFNNPKNIGA